jgi:AcrR family transcriptional regulator
VTTRRTQAERRDATTTQLVDAARTLFGRNGYAATSIEAIAAAAGMTKGAAYHHFGDKPALFRAVFVLEQQWMTGQLDQAAGAAPDAWAALVAGYTTFLRRCLQPGFRRITLRDGPAVLGWDTVREIESDHVLRVLTDGLAAAAADGYLIPGDLTIRSRLLFGALCEGGMLLGRAENPDRALDSVLAEATRLLGALRAD